MFNSIRKNLYHQINLLKKRFAQTEGLPFYDILICDTLSKIIEKTVGRYRNRVYPPVVTLSAFISQILDADHSCKNAVAKVLAERIAQGETACSSDTGPYCKARQRLPEELVSQLVCETGKALHEQSETSWRWKGRSVKLVDGTTVSMPDTPENQAVYPQLKEQKAGLGFPIARLVAMISLSSGSIINYSMCKYYGKQTGEHALLRNILDGLSEGDVLLGDRYYCSYFLIAELKKRSVDAVFQIHASRKSDFRKGIKLGVKDHMVTWKKPLLCPQWMDKATYDEIPDTLTLREIKSKGKVIVSTMIDPKMVSRNELSQLYSQRWQVEIDLKFIKDVLKMDVLRCKTPEMVQKEIAVHLLTYNLIRTVMAQAACLAGVSPRTLSFKGTLQLLEAFKHVILNTAESQISEVYNELLKAIARHRIGQLSSRIEPRAVKRRPKSHPRLTKARQKYHKKPLLEVQNA